MSEFSDFIEKNWGLIDGSWSIKDESNIKVIRFKDSPLSNLFTFMTLGVSNSILEIENQLIRQEYLIVSNSNEEEIVNFSLFKHTPEPQY